MPVTPDVFAESIKKKYPQYSQVPNAQLAKAMVEKYPEYAGQVTFPKPDEQYVPADQRPPDNARYPKLGPTGYKAADFATKLLPGAGATTGGILASESGPGAVLAATAGAGLGERAEHYLKNKLYDLPPESDSDQAKSMGTQMILGGASEFGAQGAKGLLTKLIRPMEASAETVKAAEAGKGIRLSPGEAVDSHLLKRTETVTQHLLLGGASPIEAFKTAQEGDIMHVLSDQLNSLSPRGLSGEQVGQQVQTIVKAAEEAANKAPSAYKEVKDMLGLPANATKADIDAAIGTAEQPSSILDANGRPASTPPPATAARAKLAEASKLYHAEKNRVQTDIMGKIIATQKPEIIGSYFTKAGLGELRQMDKVLPPEVKQDVARNVLENMISKGTDPQSGDIGARSLASGLKELGEGRGRLIFGKQYEAIKDASALMNRIQEQPKSQGMGIMHAARISTTAATALAGLVGSMFGHAGGLEAAAGMLGGEASFSRVLALALTHPQATAGALKVLKGAAVAGARGIPYVADESFQASPALYPAGKLTDGVPAQ